MDENKNIQNAENNNGNPNDKPTPVPEGGKPKKEAKGNVFTNGIRKIGNGVNWCVDKVVKHPRAAIVVISTVGTVAGYFLKAAVDILRAPDDEVDGPIETEFVDSEDDENPETTENSTEE